jgi:hypothetical protein
LALAQSSSTMTALQDFFHGSDTTLGVFYPRHCLVAVFLRESEAGTAAGLLRAAGIAPEEMIVASGRDVLALAGEETGLGGLIMQALSRFFKTEQYYADRDLDQARDGAGFLIVRCVDANKKQEAWRVIQPLNPSAARYYDIGGVEHLAGDPDTD